MKSITINSFGAHIPNEFHSIVTVAKRDLTQYIEVGYPDKIKVPVKFFKTVPSGLRVPPTYITRQRALVYTDERGTPEQFKPAFHGRLHDTQKIMTKKAYIELCGSGCATLVMPTGTGKTVCALYLAMQLGLKPIVLVHKTFLAEQWKSRIAQYFGPDIRVGIVKGNQVDTSSCDIVVGLIQTFVSKQMQLPVSCGTLIIDEAHHIAAKQFRQIVMKLMTNQQYVLGLSATPTRKDGIDIRPLIGSYITYEDVLPDHIIGSSAPPAVSVHMHMYADQSYTQQNQPLTKWGKISYSELITMVSENDARTAFVCDLIQQHPTRNILVLSHRRKQCTKLHDTLKSRGLDVALFVPKAGKHATHDPPASRIIVSTFSYVSEGFDVARLDCVVFATPASNLKQSVGRILRRPDGDPIVIDICDAWGILNAQTSKRRSYYRGNKYTMYTKYTKTSVAKPVARAEPPASTPLFLPD